MRPHPALRATLSRWERDPPPHPQTPPQSTTTLPRSPPQPTPPHPQTPPQPTTTLPRSPLPSTTAHHRTPDAAPPLHLQPYPPLRRDHRRRSAFSRDRRRRTV